MPVSINGTSGLVFNDSSTQTTAATGFGFKNRIINGAMVIDQRNAGASVTPTETQYTLDRWQSRLSQTSKYTVQRNAGSVTPPAGFTNYLGVTSSSAYSVLVGDYFAQQHNIEGFNTADFAWGTASASTVTLSFWVRSSLTGTFGGSAQNASANRSYPFTYTISAANTWEQKTITIAGDTSGTWNTTNSAGLVLFFGLGVGTTYSGSAGSWSGSNFVSATGATSVVGTNGATFYITGVQLEKGSTATSFDYRPYGTELSLCQRYAKVMRGSAYTKYAVGTVGTTTTVYALTIPFSIPMRAAPSVSLSGTTVLTVGATNNTVSTVNNLSSADSACFDASIASGSFTVGQCAVLGSDSGGTSVLTLSSEL